MMKPVKGSPADLDVAVESVIWFKGAISALVIMLRARMANCEKQESSVKSVSGAR